MIKYYEPITEIVNIPSIGPDGVEYIKIDPNLWNEAVLSGRLSSLSELEESL